MANMLKLEEPVLVSDILKVRDPRYACATSRPPTD